MNSLGSFASPCQSASCATHSLAPWLLRDACGPVLYSQWAAIPNSAVWCMSCVRTWISSGFPCGPITVVCSDWYMFTLGMAT